MRSSLSVIPKEHVFACFHHNKGPFFPLVFFRQNVVNFEREPEERGKREKQREKETERERNRKEKRE
jgi:hypothetical protein